MSHRQIAAAPRVRLPGGVFTMSSAERPLRPVDYPDAPPANLVPRSLVFTPTAGQLGGASA